MTTATDFSRITLGGNPDARIAQGILRSPLLVKAVPADELSELATAHAGATRAAEEAGRLPVAAIDAEAEVTASLRAGKDIDIAKLVKKIGLAETEKAHRDRAVALLRAMPKRIEQEVISLVNAHLTDGYDVLDEALEDLLDRAEVIVRELGPVNDAESAIAADRATEWSQLRALVTEYEALRADHLRILRAEDSLNFGNGAPAIGTAFFGGLHAVVPDFTRIVRRELLDGMGKPVGLPFDVLNPASVDHFLTAVRERATLLPRIGRVDEAMGASIRLPIGETAFRGADGELVTRRLSPRDEYIMREARNERGTLVEEEREAIASRIS